MDPKHELKMKPAIVRFKMLKYVSAGLIIGVALAESISFAQSVAQSMHFPTIAGFPDYSDMHLEPNNWNQPFPFNSAEQITKIALDFTSTDPSFSSGIGPSGGESGVAIRLSHALSSFVPGNQNLIYDPSVLPSFAVARQMLADGILDVELHGFENFPGGGYSQPLEFNEASSLSITVEGPIGTVTQTHQFPQLPGGFSAAGRIRFDASGWSAPFPFSDVSQISKIRFDFATVDSDFNSGTAPNGGDPGVGFQIVEELGSVESGNQSIILDHTVLPYFTIAATMLADGATTAGLAGFEGFPTFSLPSALSSASTLTVTVVGVPEPSTLALIGSVYFLVYYRSRRLTGNA